MQSRFIRHVPAFGAAGGVLFAAAALTISMAMTLVAAGVIVAVGSGILLQNVATDAAQAGQAAFTAQESATSTGYSISNYAQSTSYVENAVDGIVQIDATSLPSVHLNAPVTTILPSGQVHVTLSGTLVDSVLAKAFATLVPSNPSAQFPVSASATGQIG